MLKRKEDAQKYMCGNNVWILEYVKPCNPINAQALIWSNVDDVVYFWLWNLLDSTISSITLRWRSSNVCSNEKSSFKGWGMDVLDYTMKYRHMSVYVIHCILYYTWYFYDMTTFN